MRHPQDAEMHLNQACQARPSDEEVNLLLARSQLFNKKESSAGDTLKRALEANPESEKLLLAVVRFYLDRKEVEQALRVLDKGLERQPRNLSLLRVRGKIEASAKDFAKAEQDFRKMIEFSPAIPAGYIELGNLMLARSRFDEAIAQYKSAMELENGWPDALSSLVKAYLIEKRPESALSAAKAETVRHSDSALAHFILAQTLLAAGKPDESKAAFRKASELAPLWPDPYRGLAAVFLKENKLDSAIQRIETDYNKHTDSVPLCMQLALYHEIAGHYEDAIRYYGILVQQKNCPSEILNDLAYLCAEYSSTKDALKRANELANRALFMQPDKPGFIDTLAWIYFKQGEPGPAWDILQSALLIAPENETLNMHAAAILHEIGRKDEALAYLDKVLQQKQDSELFRKAAELKTQWTAAGK
jgi:tetratricopeptide (TPR) repeat protein